MVPFSLDSVIAIGLILSALAYLWSQLRQGNWKADKDLITTLTEQLKAQKEINDSLRDQMQEMQRQVNALTEQIGILKGEKSANDQKIKEYLQIIANRNPELEATLKQLEELIRQVVPFMKDVRHWHEDIRKKLDIPESQTTQ